MTMPIANISEDIKKTLTEEELQIINKVLKIGGVVRATKPKVIESNPITGKAAYVWRMVVFQVSPKPPHQCMPVTANFDLPAYDENGKWSSVISRGMEKELDKLVNHIVDSVPKAQWHGINRWGRAFGYI
jgi:hypothetical protein